MNSSASSIQQVGLGASGPLQAPLQPGNGYLLSYPTIGLIILSTYLIWLSSSVAPTVKAPVAGYRSIFEPTFFLRMRFIFNAVEIMNNGYQKFKNSSYVVRRMDTDVTVIAAKYLDELRNSGLDELNATHANINNVVGSHTNLNEMKTNDMFIKVLTHCLNPKLNDFVKDGQDELNYSLRVDMPDFQGQEWKSVDIHTLLRRMVSRIACRIMLGVPHCRDETLVSITESHTLAIFAVTLILRRFPPVLHYIVALFVPYRWAIWRNLRVAKTITGPILEKALAAEAEGKADLDATAPKTLFEWMVANAKPHQKSLESLVTVQMAVTVAAVYTSSQVLSHMLVFLAIHPQYIEELRNEIVESNSDMDNIETSKLHKMEACLTETLRLSPPQTNAPQRRAMRDVRLKDGLIIPKGALIAFPCTPLSIDPDIYPEPKEFRPFRAENLEVPATTPTRNKLAFGWGSQACPGRFIATKEIKLIAAKLLMQFDIDIAPECVKMRRSYDIEDLRVLNPRMRLLMRRRAER